MKFRDYLKENLLTLKELISETGIIKETLTNWFKNRFRVIELMVKGIKMENLEKYGLALVKRSSVEGVLDELEQKRKEIHDLELSLHELQLVLVEDLKKGGDSEES